ncbi:hypothetical protein [Mucilaginibacter antarcticus]|uniref:hypothetical protein n=1 Tax=Mucilaginibacter antarcticus TaxID=1855725 RepID=UPI00363BDEB4
MVTITPTNQILTMVLVTTPANNTARNPEIPLYLVQVQIQPRKLTQGREMLILPADRKSIKAKIAVGLKPIAIKLSLPRCRIMNNICNAALTLPL